MPHGGSALLLCAVCGFRGDGRGLSRSQQWATLPVKPRQIMYRARPYILERTGEASLNGQYFSQTLLIDYMEEYDCSDWP